MNQKKSRLLLDLGILAKKRSDDVFDEALEFLLEYIDDYDIMDAFDKVDRPETSTDECNCVCDLCRHCEYS